MHNLRVIGILESQCKDVLEIEVQDRIRELTEKSVVLQCIKNDGIRSEFVSSHSASFHGSEV